jgi:hypothetical protein
MLLAVQDRDAVVAEAAAEAARVKAEEQRKAQAAAANAAEALKTQAAVESAVQKAIEDFQK